MVQVGIAAERCNFISYDFLDKNLTTMQQNQKTDTKFKFSIPDLPRMSQQRGILARLMRKHNQTCVCNGAVNPHRKFRTRKMY